MPQNARYMKTLSIMLAVFVFGYFFSKGLMNVGFYACVIGGIFALPVKDPGYVFKTLGTVFCVMLACLGALILLEYVSWNQSPYRNLLERSMIHKEWELLVTFCAPVPLAFILSHTSERMKIKLGRIAILGVLFLGILGSLQWLLYKSGSQALRFTTEDRPAHGLQALAIFYAYQLLPFVVLLMSSLMEKDGILHTHFSPQWRRISCAAVVFGWIGILGSENRAALILLFLSVPILMLRQKPRLVFPVIAALILLGGIVLTSTTTGDRIRNFSSDPGSSHRILLWKTHVRAWSAHPLIGVGRRLNTQHLFDDYLRDEKEKLGPFTWYGAHNTYLDLLSGLGLTGLLLVLVFWLAIPWKVLVKTPQPFAKGARGACLFSLSLSLGVWFLSALTENNFDSTFPRASLPVLMACLIVASQWSDSNQDSSVRN